MVIPVPIVISWIPGGAVNIHPELLPPSVELAPAYHAAPPVAVDRLIDRKSALTVPLALDSVWLAAVTEPMVKSLVDSPLAFQLVKVLVAFLFVYNLLLEL